MDTCCICGKSDAVPYKGADNLKLVKCPGCSLIFVSPMPGPAVLKDIYEAHYYNNKNSLEMGYDNYSEEETNIRKTALKRLKYIERYAKKGKLLDVGCAFGFFMDTARKNGWDVSGIEISRVAIEHALKIGLNVTEGNIDIMDLPGEKYNLITLWDVVEHLTKPKEVLVKLRQRLDKGGILVLSTPDIGSIPARLTGGKWIGFKSPREHLWYFSKTTISKLLAETGFRVKKVFYAGKHVSLSMFIDRLSRYLPPAGKLNLGGVSRKISFYANPLDISCVLAERQEDGQS